MDFLVDRLKFLGLNGREIRVFTMLSTFGRMNMTKTASRAGLPRTTVDAVIRRLVEQGLIVRERVDNHFEYSVQLNSVADTLGWIEDRLRPKDTKDFGGTISSLKNDDKIVKSYIKKECLDVESAFKERAGDRVRVLLARTPDGLADAKSRFMEYTRNATETNTKLEILACSQVADAIQNADERYMRPMDKNLIRLNVVPSSYCRSGSDILVFPDRVLMRSIRDGKVAGVMTPEVVEAMKHLLEIACETGWSINLAAWIAEA